MADSLQQLLVIDHLEAHDSLPDTQTLTLPGATSPATYAGAQITILGAFNSSAERYPIYCPRSFPLPNRLYPFR